MTIASPRQIEVVITYLDMETAPDRPAAITPPGKVAIVRAEAPTLSFYRYLYDTVGGPWLWWYRRLMEDDELTAILARPETHVYVLYVGGVPAGYAELNLSALETDGVIDLAYMGLIPDFIGRGYGKYLLNWAVDTAWALRPRRLTVNTCTLDHPDALGAYQKAGFTVYDQHRETIDDPRDTGLIAAFDHHIDRVQAGHSATAPQENDFSNTLVVDFPDRAR